MFDFLSARVLSVGPIRPAPIFQCRREESRCWSNHIWSIDLFPFGVFCEGWKYYIYYSIISISCYKKWKERNSICFFNELFVITFHHTIRSPWKFRGKWSSIHFDRFETASLLLKVMTIFIWTWEIGWSSLNRYFRSILIRKLALRIWFSSSLFTYHYVWSY